MSTDLFSFFKIEPSAGNTFRRNDENSLVSLTQECNEVRQMQIKKISNQPNKLLIWSDLKFFTGKMCWRMEKKKKSYNNSKMQSKFSFLVSVEWIKEMKKIVLKFWSKQLFPTQQKQLTNFDSCSKFFLLLLIQPRGLHDIQSSICWVRMQVNLRARGRNKKIDKKISS